MWGSSSNGQHGPMYEVAGSFQVTSGRFLRSFALALAIVCRMVPLALADVPGSPGGVTTQAGDSQITLTWGYPGAPGDFTYNIYYGATPGVTPTSPNTTKVTSVTNQYTVTGLTNGFTYYFVVTDLNSSGESAPSASVSAVPVALAPLPGSIIATGTSSDAVGDPFVFGPGLGSARSLARGTDGKLHVVYARGTPLNIYYAYSTNNGQNWTEEPVSSQTNGQAGLLAMAVDSANNVHVVWNGPGWGTHTAINNIEYRERTPAGGWQPVVNLTDNATDQYSQSLAVDSQDNVHVVWHGFGWGANPASDNIEYRERTGAGWQPVQSVTDFNAPGVFQAPAIAIDSANTVHVAWTGVNANTNAEFTNVYHRQRTSAGWQPVETVTSASGYQDTVSIAVDSSNNVWLAWDGSGLGGASTLVTNIFYAERTTAWQAAQALTNQTTADQFPPSIALDGANNVYIVWEGGGLGNTTYNQDNILYTMRLGGTWQPVTALTNRPDVQAYPSFLWAAQPTVGSARIDRPKTGYAIVWGSMEGGLPKVCYLPTANLTWDAGTSPCDVNRDGFTNILDVQLEVNAAMGVIPCTPTYDINKDGLCNIIDVQRVTNAALGGSCNVSP